MLETNQEAMSSNPVCGGVDSPQTIPRLSQEQEGLRFTTNVVGCPPEDVHIGLPVRVQFEQHGEVFAPVFVPDRPG